MNFKDIKNEAKRLGIIYKAVYYIYYYCLKCRDGLKEYRLRERKCSYGDENADKVFYVIGIDYATGGLFAIIKSIFSHINYAIDKGYIPVVDMQHFYSYLVDKNDPHARNMWEFLFEQPCGYTLDDISKSKNVIKSSRLAYVKGYPVGFDNTLDEAFSERYHARFRKYVRPNAETKQYVDDIKNKLFGENMKILGGEIRGTDYSDNHPVGHPIQPTAEMFISKAKEVMDDGGYDYFFLATEDKRIHDKVRAAFGYKVIFVEQDLYESTMGKQYLVQIPKKSEADKLRGVLDYYATISLLAQCHGLVAGMNGGTIGAYLMSDGYEYVYIWDLGKYE